MRMFMADCDLPGTSRDSILQTQQMVIDACEHLAAEGLNVRFIRSIWVPDDWRVMHLFEAPDVAAVQAVGRMARIAFLRVIEAIDLAVKADASTPRGRGT